MDKIELYKHYIPALIKALNQEKNWEQYSVKGAEFFMELPDEIQKEAEIYIE